MWEFITTIWATILAAFALPTPLPAQDQWQALVDASAMRIRIVIRVSLWVIMSGLATDHLLLALSRKRAIARWIDWIASTLRFPDIQIIRKILGPLRYLFNTSTAWSMIGISWQIGNYATNWTRMHILLDKRCSPVLLPPSLRTSMKLYHCVAAAFSLSLMMAYLLCPFRKRLNANAADFAIYASVIMGIYIMLAGVAYLLLTTVGTDFMSKSTVKWC